MKKIVLGTLIALSFGLSSTYAQQKSGKINQSKKVKKMDNKTLVQTAMNELFVKRDVTALDRYWADGYIQHNPTIADGKEDLIPMIKGLPANFKYESGLVIANDNYVMIHGRYTGLAPEPLIIVDIFRVENGKLKEHWDVMQTEVKAEKAVNGNTMFPISQPKADKNDNRKLVQDYLNDLFIKKDAKLTEKYWGTDMIQHNPTMPNGLDVLRGFASNIPQGFKYVPGIAVADGDKVMIHGYYEGWGPKPLVAVDIFRIENGKVVEHWDVMQEFVPDNQTKSGHSMQTIKK
ncbi:nuclear transport factor 2 family protein [Flavobacterium ajazii]|uniref:nuclear transport factor 2 family protein n=1 Tax=Flavobacterium ajazii TaxID=2692318 RepID=UPI001CB6F674|nr:nuclear transport factor 2 family protein [Flavobacterium ajazii]